MEDIAPELLRLVQQTYENKTYQSRLLAEIEARINSEMATYIDAGEYADEVGKILAEAYSRNLSSSVLPNGRMYWNIAQRVVDPTMEKAYINISDMTMRIQTLLNQKAGIGIQAIRPELNLDRIAGIDNRLCREENYDNISWILDAPVQNFARSIVDDSIKKNSEFHGKAGMRPKIIRRSSGNCCKWCDEIAGTYFYPDVPNDVYRRHKKCDCVVEYAPGNGRRKNVHTKQWRREEENDKIKQRMRYASGSRKTNYARQYNPYFDSAGVVSAGITPEAVEKELEISPIGREILKYIKTSGVRPQFIYGKQLHTDRGSQEGKKIKIFISNIENTRIAAQTVIHEMTHYRYDIGRCQWAEVVCMAQEKMHITKRNYLTLEEKRTLINLVKASYPEYNWKKGGYGNGRYF